MIQQFSPPPLAETTPSKIGQPFGDSPPTAQNKKNGAILRRGSHAPPPGIFELPTPEFESLETLQFDTRPG